MTQGRFDNLHLTDKKAEGGPDLHYSSGLLEPSAFIFVVLLYDSWGADLDCIAPALLAVAWVLALTWRRVWGAHPVP